MDGTSRLIRPIHFQVFRHTLELHTHRQFVPPLSSCYPVISLSYLPPSYLYLGYLSVDADLVVRPSDSIIYASLFVYHYGAPEVSFDLSIFQRLFLTIFITFV